jgi:sterol desaturase/sphingolipid hydroxylase (fatty acid hydroxylase superfamily)
VFIIPLLFIKINLSEFLIANSVIYYHAIITHSEKDTNFVLPLFINSNYHKYHHQIGRGNYGILFSIWDDYMGTRIPKINIKNHNKRIKDNNKRIKDNNKRIKDSNKQIKDSNKQIKDNNKRIKDNNKRIKDNKYQ